MPYTVVKDADQFLYLTDKFGSENDNPQALTRITDADRAKAEELKSRMFDEATLVVRNEETGEYGIFLETSEYAHAESADVGEPDMYNGYVIAGRLLGHGELPTLNEAIQECSCEAKKLSELFPDLHIEVRHGDNTWGGAVMLTAFIPESSPLIHRVSDVGEAMFEIMRSDKTGYAIPAPSM